MLRHERLVVGGSTSPRAARRRSASAWVRPSALRRQALGQRVSSAGHGASRARCAAKLPSSARSTRAAVGRGHDQVGAGLAGPVDRGLGRQPRQGDGSAPGTAGGGRPRARRARRRRCRAGRRPPAPGTGASISARGATWTRLSLPGPRARSRRASASGPHRRGRVVDAAGDVRVRRLPGDRLGAPGSTPGGQDQGRAGGRRRQAPRRAAQDPLDPARVRGRHDDVRARLAGPFDQAGGGRTPQQHRVGLAGLRRQRRRATGAGRAEQPADRPVATWTTDRRSGRSRRASASPRRAASERSTQTATCSKAPRIPTG